MKTTRRRAGLSQHCQTEGPHGLHWVPSGMWDDMLLSDLCTGPPKAYVIGRDGKRREIMDVEFVSTTGLFRFRYPDWGPTGPHDYAPPEKVVVDFA